MFLDHVLTFQMLDEFDANIKLYDLLIANRQVELRRFIPTDEAERTLQRP